MGGFTRWATNPRGRGRRRGRGREKTLDSTPGADICAGRGVARLHRKRRKNARRSSARSSGSSAAAKWPPRGISVQCCTLYPRSIQTRGGKGSSLGKWAIAVGAWTNSPSPNCSGAFLPAKYKRNEEWVGSQAANGSLLLGQAQAGAQ